MELLRPVRECCWLLLHSRLIISLTASYQLSAISYMLVIYELLPEVFVLIRMMFLAALVGMSFIKSGDGECHERLI